MNRELMKQCLDALNRLSESNQVEFSDIELIESIRAELAKDIPEPYGYVSEHNCTGPFKHQFHLTLETIYPDNCKSITPVYTKGNQNV